MARHTVDWARLVLALDLVCATRGISLRTAAKEMGIAASALTRVRQGHSLNADALVSLLMWMPRETQPPGWIKES